MAEAFAVLGVASSLVTFIQVAGQILQRIKEYNDVATEMPVVIRHIDAQLPLLTEKMESLKERTLDGLAISPQTGLGKAVLSCERQIKLLDDLVLKLLPKNADTKFLRAKKIFWSIYREKDVEKAWDEMEQYKTTLILHFTNITPPSGISMLKRTPTGSINDTVGLARLFKACISTFDSIQSAKSFANCESTVAERFNRARRFLQIWAKSIGIERSSQSYIPKTLCDEDYSTACKILIYLNNMFAKTEITNLFAAQDGQADQDLEIDPPAKNQVNPGPVSGNTQKGYASAVERELSFGSRVDLFCEFLSILYSSNAAEPSEDDNILRDSPDDESFEFLTDVDPTGRAKWILEMQNSPLDLIRLFEDQSRETALRWLGADLINSRYEDALASRLNGTCDWLFKEPVYCQWDEDNQNPEARLLWISASPGFGKTILCARIVEHLKITSSRRVLHAFCSSKSEMERDPLTVLRQWLHQLLHVDPDNRKLIEQASQKETSYRASATELWQILKRVLESSTGYTLVLDGLDECFSRNESVSQGSLCTKDSFLRSLKALMQNSDTRVLITSRDDGDIRAQLDSNNDTADGIRILVFRITEASVRVDVESFCKSVIDHYLPNKKEVLRKELALKWSRNCGGMFQSVKLQSGQLRPTQSPKQVEKIISRTPHELSSLYKSFAKNLRSDDDKEQAVRILSCVLLAERPLAVIEIQAANIILQTEDIDVFPIDELCDVPIDMFANEEILKIYTPLIEICSTGSAPESQIVQLSHQSAREFLLSPNFPEDVGFEEMLWKNGTKHNHMVTVCLQYLCYGNVSLTDTLPASKASLADVFLDYALHHWKSHMKKCEWPDPTLSGLLVRFFELDKFRLRFIHQSFELDGYEPNLGRRPLSTNLPTGLYYAINHGLPEIAIAICERGAEINIVGGRYGTPLVAAAYNGLMDLVVYLLDRNADVNLEAGVFGQALSAAVKRGHLTIAKLLLERGAKPDRPKRNMNHPLNMDNEGLRPSPMYWAAKAGYKEIIKLLLEYGIDLTEPSQDQYIPLNAAASYGHGDVVELLLVNGVDKSETKTDGRTALYSAARNGNYDCVRILLEHGADVTTPARNGWTTLRAASYYGHPKTVELLLVSGADPSIVPKPGGWTALYSAASNGQYDCVKVLLEHGADVTMPDHNGWTPLHAASYYGHPKTVELLLVSGADPSIISEPDGQTALYSAASNRQYDCVKVLLKHGADVTTPDDDGWTPLIAASNLGYVDIVELLLSSGADPSAAAHDNGWTTLYFAVSKGEYDCVKVLLECGADVTTPVQNGWTPLHKASNRGHTAIVKLLLANGADIFATCSGGETPLYWACLRGKYDCVEILLERGADTAMVTQSGWTPLIAAARNGHMDTVELLLSNGADMNAANENLDTALSLAASGGHEAIVQLLLNRGIENVDMKNKFGETPLSAAARRGHETVVRQMLDVGKAKIEAKDKFNRTPLTKAARNGQEAVVRLLLERGAAVDNIDIYGLTPLFLAEEKQREAVVQLLVDHGAYSSPKDKHGRSPRPSTWGAFCDGCGTGFPDLEQYFHCDICDGGDFDLCEVCSSEENACRLQGHEMTERVRENPKLKEK